LPANILQLPAAERRKLIRQAIAEIRVTSPFSARHANELSDLYSRLQRLYLALEGVSTEVWLDREDVPRGGQGKGYVVVHGHQLVQDLKVVCDGKEAEVVRKPEAQTPFDGMSTAAPTRPIARGVKPPAAAGEGEGDGDGEDGAA